MPELGLLPDLERINYQDSANVLRDDDVLLNSNRATDELQSSAAQHSKGHPEERQHQASRCVTL
eukprot:1046329-Pyramimonas_sp.AAC.1